ncbi:MAG: hypothetical protein ACRDG4_09380, partial [Chloroflexota bacterium]
MLETVRQYGQLKLAEGAEQAPHARRLTWLAEHCESVMGAWSAADQGPLLRRLDSESENIRDAL